MHVQVYMSIIIIHWYNNYGMEVLYHNYNNYTGVEVSIVLEEYIASHESAWYIPSKYLSSTHGLYRQS